MEDTLNKDQFVLLDAFLSNREEHLKAFYISQYPKAKNYILKNGGTLENAKDAFQEAYLACWKKLSTGKFKPKNRAELEAYLFTIAKNKWIDQTRTVAKRKTISIDEKVQHLTADDAGQKMELETKEQQLCITLTAFENLGEACKELLTQFYFHKMSMKIIAASLDMEEASVKNKKYRCIQKLRELALGPEMGSRALENK